MRPANASAPRDVELLAHSLQSLAAAATALAAQIEDLHALAYDRPSSGEVPGRGNGETDPLTGDAYARKVFVALAARAQRADEDLRGFKATVAKLFNVGTADPDLYGSEISRREHSGRLANQRKQAAAGRYIPHRNLPHPPYPAKGGKR